MTEVPGRDGIALSRYLREIRAYPLLDRDDERRLVRRLEQGDAEAESRLIQSNLSFVVKVAMEYRSLGVPLEDLLNEGNLGLIQAARRFDRNRGTRFITYAIWWIRKAILKAISDHALVVRVPPYRRKKIYDLRKAESEIRTRLGRPATRAELAEHLAVDVADVDRVRRQQLGQISLDRPVGENDGTTLLDFLADDRSSAEECMLGEEAGRMVAAAFRELSPRAQAVLDARLGLHGRPQRTLKEISAELEVSRERVRQIENEAKQQLRRRLLARRRLGARPRPDRPGGMGEQSR